MIKTAILRMISGEKPAPSLTVMTSEAKIDLRFLDDEYSRVPNLARGDWQAIVRLQASHSDHQAAEAGADFIIKQTGQLVYWNDYQIPGIQTQFIELEKFTQYFRTPSKFQPAFGWHNFDTDYPDSTGCITASRVGFSRDGTVAFFYVQRSRNSLSAECWLYIFRRRDGRWVIDPKVSQIQWAS